MAPRSASSPPPSSGPRTGPWSSRAPAGGCPSHHRAGRGDFDIQELWWRRCTLRQGGSGHPVPAAGLVQFVADATDPINYAPYWHAEEPHFDGTPAHVLSIHGLQDVHTPLDRRRPAAAARSPIAAPVGQTRWPRSSCPRKPRAAHRGERPGLGRERTRAPSCSTRSRTTSRSSRSRRGRGLWGLPRGRAAEGPGSTTADPTQPPPRAWNTLPACGPLPSATASPSIARTSPTDGPGWPPPGRRCALRVGRLLLQFFEASWMRGRGCSWRCPRPCC